MKEPHYGFIHLIIKVLLYPWTARVRCFNTNLQTLSHNFKEGQVLFVGQGASFVDLLVLNEILKQNNMPTIQFTHGISPFLVMPFFKAVRVWSSQLLRDENDVHAEELDSLVDNVLAGENGLIFLKKRGLGSKIHYYQGFLGRLAKRINENKRPIFLTPASVFLTRKRKSNTPRTSFDIFFRSYDIPSRSRKMFQLLVNYRKGGAVFSKHIDLLGEMAKDQDKEFNEKVVDKRLRWTLLFHLNNEDRAYRGPNKRSKEHKVRKILKERLLNEELHQVAERTNRPVESVQKEAAKTLHEIASDTSERVINLLRIFLDYVWARTLEDIDFKEEDLARIREITRKGPVVFLPCHRSHVDYMVLPYIFESNGLIFPRIAAGDNLSKWPLGAVVRRAGAFFIRRSFKGETIFPLVFDAYVRHLLRERHAMAFFMEGGRSRTGKLLHPKMGMLAMVVDAWRKDVVDDLPIIPVTIDYGRIFEGGAYVREKSGEEKVKENLRTLVNSRGVLRRKHGVLRLRFGDALWLNDFAAQAGLSKEKLGFKTKAPFIHNLGYHMIGQINQMVTLTAGNIVASLLMNNPRRGMTMEELKALFIISCRYLRYRKVELAFPEKRLDMAMENAITSFVDSEMLVKIEVSGQTVINVPEDKRNEMEYYKNNGLHFVLDQALFCMALSILPPESRTIDEILPLAQEIYRALSKEFLYRDEFPTRDMLEECLRVLTVIDALKQNEEGLISFGAYKFGRHLVHINAHMLLNFLESYFTAAETLADLDGENPPDKKSFPKLCIARGRLLYAVGALRRRESVNKLTFANALDAFSDGNFIQSRKTKGQRYPLISLREDKRDAFIALKDRLFTWLNELN